MYECFKTGKDKSCVPVRMSSPGSLVFIRTRLVRSRCVERFSAPAEILKVHISVRLEPGRDAPVVLLHEDGCWAAGGWGGGGW